MLAMTLTGSFGLGLDPDVGALNAFLAAAGVSVHFARHRILLT